MEQGGCGAGKEDAMGPEVLRPETASVDKFYFQCGLEAASFSEGAMSSCGDS
jgi:hypothetical protein